MTIHPTQTTMNVFLVNAHAEPQSFNSALFHTAQQTLRDAGHVVTTSDLHAILRPVQRGILRFTGWDVLAPNIVYAPVRVSDAERQAALQAWAARLRAIQNEQPIEVGEY